MSIERETKKKKMKDSNNDGYVRADQIDLKSLDEQLQRHLNRALTLERKRKEEEERRQPSRAEWEIDPSKLLIKSVIARGTFGTVHRGVYDGLDVAGFSYFIIYLCCLTLCIKFNFILLVNYLFTILILLRIF